jgi:Integrase core domain
LPPRKTLKYEAVYRNEYRDLAEARASIEEFLEKVYNQKRLDWQGSIQVTKFSSCSNENSRTVFQPVSPTPSALHANFVN